MVNFRVELKGQISTFKIWKNNVIWLLNSLKEDPFRKPPENEALVGDLERSYSRRINIQHRMVYQVYEKEKVVKIIRMWTHYGE